LQVLNIGKVKGKEESVSKARKKACKAKEQIKPVSGIAQDRDRDSDRLHRKG